MAAADLGAPYCERERERPRQLCEALRRHARIEINLKDFFGDQAVNPPCIAEVDCGFAFETDVTPGGTAAAAPEEPTLEQALRKIRGALQMSVAPGSIAFCLLEQVN